MRRQYMPQVSTELRYIGSMAEVLDMGVAPLMVLLPAIQIGQLAGVKCSGTFRCEHLCFSCGKFDRVQVFTAIPKCCLTSRRSQPPLALAVPLSWFTS